MIRSAVHGKIMAGIRRAADKLSYTLRLTSARYSDGVIPVHLRKTYEKYRRSANPADSAASPIVAPGVCSRRPACSIRYFCR